MLEGRWGDRNALVAAALENDQGAYSALFAPLWKVAFVKAYRILRDKNAAENVAQDCCLKLFLRLDTLRLENLEGWMTTCARNAAISLIRRRLREVPIDSVPSAGSTQTPGPDHERLLQLRECLERLPGQHRDAVLLSKIEGNRLQDVARILDSNVNTVGVWVSRGLRRLRLCLETNA